MARPPRTDASFHREHMPPEQRNGAVHSIDYRAKEVTVVYHDGSRVTYGWDELDYCHSDKFNGIYYPDR